MIFFFFFCVGADVSRSLNTLMKSGTLHNAIRCVITAMPARVRNPSCSYSYSDYTAGSLPQLKLILLFPIAFRFHLSGDTWRKRNKEIVALLVVVLLNHLWTLVVLHKSKNFY